MQKRRINFWCKKNQIFIVKFWALHWILLGVALDPCALDYQFATLEKLVAQVLTRLEHCWKHCKIGCDCPCKVGALLENACK